MTTIGKPISRLSATTVLSVDTEQNALCAAQLLKRLIGSEASSVFQSEPPPASCALCKLNSGDATKRDRFAKFLIVVLS